MHPSVGDGADGRVSTEPQVAGRQCHEVASAREEKSLGKGVDKCFLVIASVWQSEISERPPTARDGHLGHSSRQSRFALGGQSVARSGSGTAERRVGRQVASDGQRRDPVSYQLRDVAVLAALRAV